MEKVITYKKKYSKANTVYTTISSSDHKYIFDELNKIIKFIDDCKEFDHPDISRILYETTVLDKNLPKTGYKPYIHNSMYGYVKGLIHNLTVGTQRDLSINNLSPISYITEYMANNLYHFSKINFKSVDKT